MLSSFLDTIEGTSGEELTSAVLKYLIVNSSVFRESIISRISANVVPGYGPTFHNGVFCQTEYSTQDETLGQGFIDVLVCDGEPRRPSFAIAIEVKLWALFTPNQPKKYMSALMEMVESDENRIAIVVIVPSARQQEVKKHLDEQGLGRSAIWNWDEIRGDLEQVAREDVQQVAIVAQWLVKYVEMRVGGMYLKGMENAYVGKHINLPNGYHYDFLEKLKATMAETGPIRAGCKYIGFKCSTSETGSSGLSRTVWVGFIASNDGEIAFGVDDVVRTAQRNAAFREWKTFAFQKLAFDENWKSILHWRDRLSNEFKQIEQLARQ